MALTYTTAGESHGRAVIATLFGLPAGHRLDLERIQAQLARRQKGYGRGGRMKIEQDVAEVLSGLRHGMTLGSPLTLCLFNKDARIDKAPPVSNVRPGHADLAGALKIGSRDARDVLERASARETAARVMAGAACQGLLAEFGMAVTAHVLAIGGIDASSPCGPGAQAIVMDAAAAIALRDQSELFTLDQTRDAEIKARIDQAKAAGDTLGGVIEVVATNLPPGLGSPNTLEARLDARLGAALLGIQAIKAVELGLGCEAARRPGSAVHDPVVKRTRPQSNNPTPYGRAGNNAGGIEGGITNGEPLVLRAHMKPISTLMNPLPTVDLATGEAANANQERSDVCAVPAAAIVVECAVAFELCRALLEKTGGDSLEEARRNFDAYLTSLRAYPG
ncbi:MAG: chorismate synthase [Planctomycetota bacterium]|nr:chorismate synthase [Planctomycetota bacterium]GIK51083.1 MAG: chorismate synthase [Planctomycetota bacterium]